MPTTIYDSSLITQRHRDKTISGSFINRIQNTTGSAPLLGISDQSIINTVKTGQMAQYRKTNGCMSVNHGCPCDRIQQIQQYVWVTQMNGYYDQGNGIATDATSVYVVGYFNDNSIIYSTDGNPFSTQLIGNDDAFIVKYDRNGIVQWATKIGGPNFDNRVGITTDATGIYVIGSFNNNATIYNADGSPFSTQLSGNSDTFVVKYDINGIVQWVTKIEGQYYAAGFGITTDVTGIYVTGIFNENSTIYNADGSAFTQVTGNGNDDAFIVKYDRNGIVQWVTKIGGPNFDNGVGITTDATGVYVTGLFSNIATIYNADGSPFSQLTAILNFDTFVVKYDINGIVQWATTTGGSIYSQGNGITTDATGVYVTGYFNNTATIYNADGSAFTQLTGNGNEDAFIVKYDRNGIVQWATKIGGPNFDNRVGITTDATGIYVIGSFNNNATIYNADGSPFSTQLSGNSDTFVVKYDINGIVQWVTKIEGQYYAAGFGITTDVTGIYVTGIFNENSTIYNADGSAFTQVTGNGNDDAFIVKYDRNGIVQWVTKIGGPNFDNGVGITTDATGVYVTGLFSNIATIYNSDGTISRTLTGNGNNTFIVKYDTNGNIVKVNIN